MYSGYKSSSHNTLGGNTISTTDGTTTHNWQFGVDGRLIFPDATVQATAYSGQSGLSGYSGFSGANGADNIIRQDTPPVANNGSLWFNTAEGRMYIKYTDVWVDASPLVMPQPDPDLDVNSVTFADASVQTTAFVGTAVVDRLTNGTREVVLNSAGDLLSSKDIIAVQGGRFIKDCGDSGSTTSMRWINIPDDQEVEIIRVYTGDPEGVGDAERLQLSVEWQTATQSGLSISAFDRTAGTIQHTWEFRGDGNLTLPAGGDIRDETSNISVLKTRIGDTWSTASNIHQLTIANDEGKLITVAGTGVGVFRLPQMTADMLGAEFEFYFNIDAGQIHIQSYYTGVRETTDVFRGSIYVGVDNATTGKLHKATATTSTACDLFLGQHHAKAGSYIKVKAIAFDVVGTWMFQGMCIGGTGQTPNNSDHPFQDYN